MYKLKKNLIYKNHLFYLGKVVKNCNVVFSATRQQNKAVWVKANPNTTQILHTILYTIQYVSLHSISVLSYTQVSDINTTQIQKCLTFVWRLWRKWICKICQSISWQTQSFVLSVCYKVNWMNTCFKPLSLKRNILNCLLKVGYYKNNHELQA